MMVKLYDCRLIHFFMFLSFGGMSMCEVFPVGDEDGWNSGINFATWSQNHNFTQGDFLVFNYAKSVHNVFEVIEETYRSCDGSSGVLDEYDSGSDRIELKEARKYWFICNVAGHCLGGMRFGIVVNSVSLNPVQSPPPIPNHGCSNGRFFPIWSSFICILAVFGILFS